MKKLLLIISLLLSVNLFAKYVPTKADKNLLAACTYVLYGTTPSDGNGMIMKLGHISGQVHFARLLSGLEPKHNKEEEFIDFDELMKRTCTKTLNSYARKNTDIDRLFSTQLTLWLKDDI